MPWTNEHIGWLEYIDTKLTVDNKNIDIYEFNYNLEEDAIFSSWAKHFRNHYCLDDLIDLFIEDTEYTTRSEYLNNLKFPEIGSAGAKTRSGDFGEILISDFI